jgi:hypothetical protein
VKSGTNGTAQVFLPDPLVTSGNLNLTPTSSRLNDYTTSVSLSHLSGRGVLESKYVKIYNGLDCGSEFGAYSETNQFSYPHDDRRFQEAMTYYFGDTFQEQIEAAGYLRNTEPAVMIAHCENKDNAYYERKYTTSGKPYARVCIGDSRKTPGAYYTDDAMVPLHELQHGNTTDNYSTTQELGNFFYDEAGALNEGISDFMALIYTDSLSLPRFDLDPRVFSRWALGKFDPMTTHVRGSHKCPIFDSDYPNCSRYPAFGLPSPSNSQTTTISFVYPDGMGWPYPAYYKGPNPAQQIFIKYPFQEEIHDASVILTGSMWDAYMAVKSLHPEDRTFAYRMMTKAVMETIRNLPMPNAATNLSPVSFIGFAEKLLTIAQVMPEFTPADRTAAADALKARGLHEPPQLAASDWLAAGSGTNLYIKNPITPGVRIEDRPSVLQDWLDSMRSSTMVTQDNTTGLNSKLDPGETAAIWFDLQNNSELTAGGVLLTVTLNDPDVTLLDGHTNIGHLSQSDLNQTQIMYGKVNGTKIVQQLNASGSANEIPTGNTYFKSNLMFDQSPLTAIWVRVKAEAPHGKVVTFQVTAKPSNGVASTKEFPVTLN